MTVPTTWHRPPLKNPASDWLVVAQGMLVAAPKLAVAFRIAVASFLAVVVLFFVGHSPLGGVVVLSLLLLQPLHLVVQVSFDWVPPRLRLWRPLLCLRAVFSTGFSFSVVHRPLLWLVWPESCSLLLRTVAAMLVLLLVVSAPTIVFAPVVFVQVDLVLVVLVSFVFVVLLAPVVLQARVVVLLLGFLASPMLFGFVPLPFLFCNPLGFLAGSNGWIKNQSLPRIP